MATFQNQATLSYQNTQTLSNIVTGEIVEPITVTKNALPTTYAIGDTVTYAVSLVNTGTVTVTGLTVTDDLGAYSFGTTTVTPLDYTAGTLRYYINGVLQPTPVLSATSPLTVTGISVPAGGNSLLLYTAEANSFAPLGADGSVTNTVTVSGTGLLEPLTAEATVTATSGGLAITKSMTPSTVSEGETLTYTLTVENSGDTPITADGGAVITDIFDPILAPITVTLDGVVLTEGTDYTYDATSGAFATLPGALTVPAATAVQDTVTGAYSLVPGTATLVISGTVTSA